MCLGASVCRGHCCGSCVSGADRQCLTRRSKRGRRAGRLDPLRRAGKWLDGEASGGARAIQVTGTAAIPATGNPRRSHSEPSSVYIVTFDARGWGGGSSTAISGPHFCNRDLGALTESWSRTALSFSPRDHRTGEGWLRFGQWEVGGAMAFDQVAVFPRIPLYRTGRHPPGRASASMALLHVFRAALFGFTQPEPAAHPAAVRL